MHYAENADRMGPDFIANGKLVSRAPLVESVFDIF